MKKCADTLIIGYGNTLREDDGFGVVVASKLADYFDTICAFQLLPEMSVDFVRYKTVVFVDVNLSVSSGVFAVPLIGGSELFGHTVTPFELIRYAKEFFGFTGDHLVFSVGAHSLDHKDSLSEPISQKAEELATFIKENL